MARVYVSSTVADLADERRAVIDWLIAAGHHPVHSYVPHTETLRDSSLSDVATCDLFVLIVGHRYGFQPRQDNPDQLSITHLEYERARQCGIPVIALLRNRIPDVSLSDIDNESGLSRVRAFRAAVQLQHRAAEFGDLRELIHTLSTGIQSGLKLRHSDSASVRDGSSGADRVNYEDIVDKLASDLANALKRELEAEKAAKREDPYRATELPRLLTTTPMMDAALKRHRTFVRNWALHVPAKDDSGDELETKQVFVPLDAFVTPRKLTVQTGNPPSKPLAVLLEESTARHTILLGPPGAGKTTSVKHLCLQLLERGMPEARPDCHRSA